MLDKTILLFGSNGQVGHELQRTLPALGEVVALDFPEIDFCSEAALRNAVRRIKPAVIVNAAAYTAVDKAECELEKAFAINARAPSLLAEEATALDAVLVHYSTDYVFDGTKTSPYVENDPPNPLSVYGKTKLAGEQAVAKAPRHFTLRTSWVISAHGHNFVKTMLRLGQERDRLRVIADQWGAPTSAAMLAEATVIALSAMDGAAIDDARWGLYHLVANGETTWNGLARHVIAKAAELGERMSATPETVEPISTAEYPTSATRPMNSRLSTEKFAWAFGFTPPDWTLGVNVAVQKLLKGAV